MMIAVDRSTVKWADRRVLVARETEHQDLALESRLKWVNRVTVVGLDFLRHGQKV